MCQTIEGGLQHINDENRVQLEMMRQTVDEKLNETVDQRLEASFSTVTQRLEQVAASLNAMQSLTHSVDELGKMVSGAHPFGVIGEAQLGTILAQMLAPGQYAQHANVRPGGCRGKQGRIRYICPLMQACLCANIRNCVLLWKMEHMARLRAQEGCLSQLFACMRVVCPKN